MEHNSETTLQSPDIQDAPPPVSGGGKGSTAFKIILTGLVMILALGALACAGFMDRGLDLASKHFPSLAQNQWLASLAEMVAADEKRAPMAPVFVRLDSKGVFSERVLLASLGQSPSEPSKVLFKTFAAPVGNPGEDPRVASLEESRETGLDSNQTPQTRAPSVNEAPVIPGADRTTSSGTPDSQESGKKEYDQDLAELLAGTAPKSVEATIAPLETGKDEESASPGDDATTSPESREREPEADSDPSDDSPDQQKVRPRPLAEPVPDRDEQAGAAQADQEKSPDPAGDDPVAESDEGPTIETRARPESAGRDQDPVEKPKPVEKPEKFKVPGSLQVSIKGYQGASATWALMTILDDSAAMGRKMKPWRPDRMSAAREFLEGVIEKMPKGSKLAVRDFYCSAAKRKRTRTSSLCLSHMLYDWSESPHISLKEKLLRVSPFGRTNPCAAAAFTLKKDFPGVKDLHPRVAILTSGMSRCRGREVVRIIDTRWAARKPHIDVIGFGLTPRAARGYYLLAKKTGGVMLKISGPDDIDKMVKKYAKALDERVTGSIHVKGADSGFKVAPNEEITLAPGSYDIVLPDVEGLEVSDRTISGIEIQSGKTSRVDVKLRKGKVRFKTAVN